MLSLTRRFILWTILLSFALPAIAQELTIVPPSERKQRPVPSKTGEPVIQTQNRSRLPVDIESYQPMPLPLPWETPDTTSHPYRLVSYNPATGEETILEFPVDSLLPESGFVPGRSFSAPGVPEEEMNHGSLDTFNPLFEISNPEDHPWRMNCKLFMTFPWGYYVGSGALIDPRHVITAGHCVYYQDGSDNWHWANNIVVVPGYEDGDAPYGYASALTMHTFTDWYTGHNLDWDIGWITLDRPVGALTDWFGYGYNDNDAFFTGSTFHQAGYPAAAPYDGELMYYWYGLYDAVTTHGLRHNDGGYGGQSGSGVYYISGSNRYIYGVLSHGVPSVYTVDTRITSVKFNSVLSNISNGIPSTADLIPLQVEVDPASVNSGDVLNDLTFCIHNYSSAAWSGDIIFYAFLSTDDIIDYSDYWLGGWIHSGFTLSLRETFCYPYGALTPIIPAGMPSGDYYIGIIMDVADSDPSNNTAEGQDAFPIHVTQLGSALDCSGAIPLTDDVPYSGTTVGGASNALYYNCVSWDETGPENVHTITLLQTGTIIASLSGLSADLDVFLLSSCDENECLAYGDAALSYYGATPGTYYVVVDGYYGASGTYTLTADFIQTIPVVEVIAPTAGHQVAGGAALPIEWSAYEPARSNSRDRSRNNALDAITDISIYYSTSPTGSWTPITTGQVNDGTYPWVPVAMENSTQCRIKVTATNEDGTGEGISGYFTIDSTPPDVEITDPADGDCVAGGGSTNIIWTATDQETGVSDIDLEYSTNGGGDWTNIDSDLPNTGSYSWNVPSVNSDQCRLRVCATDDVFNEGCEETGDFTIDSDAPTVDILTPTGGETLYADSTYDITWTAEDTLCGIQRMILQYSTNGGQSWNLIDSNEPNDGIYPWTVPHGIDSEQCRVMVCGRDYAANQSCPTTSNFTITCVSPPQPVIATISNGACDTVFVTFTYPTSTAVDSFRLKRDDITVSAVACPPGDPVELEIYHADAPTGPEAYTVAGWSEDCGEGPPSTGQTGEALSAPSQVQNLNATDGECELTVSWTDLNEDEQGYFIYRDSGLLIAVEADDTLWTDATANRGIMYTYAVRAFNACGEGPSSATNIGYRIDVPYAPTGLTVSDSICAGIQLEWTDNSSDEDGFVIIRGGIALDTTDADVTEYFDSTAVPGQSIWFVVFAINDCGYSEDTDEVTGQRAPLPAQVLDLEASDAEFCDQVRLTWTWLPFTDGYFVKRDGIVTDSVTDDEVTFWSDTTAVAGTVYSYTVTAYNSCGNGEESDPDNGERHVGVDQVENLTATQDSCDGIYLTWDDVDNEDGYVIYRNDLRIDSTATGETTYEDVPPSPGAYTYHVAAYNYCGEGELSLPADGCQATIPGQVTGLADSAGCDSLFFTWDEVPNTDYYCLYENGLLRICTSQLSLAIIVSDTEERTYAVEAVNHCGAGPQSEPVTTARLSIPEPPVLLSASSDSCNNVTLIWTDESDNEDGFRISRNDGFSDSAAADVEIYQDTTAVPGISYDYTVDAYNICGLSGFVNQRMGTRRSVPEQVTGLTAEDECGLVTLSWIDVDDEEGYLILQDGSPLGTTVPDATSIEFNIPTPGTYWFSVLAFNECGDGEASDSVEVVIEPPLEQVQNLSATTDSCDEIVLTWDDVENEDVYWIYVGGGETPFDSTETDVTTYSDTSSPGTYSYTVAAKNICGLGIESDPATGVRLGVPDNPVFDEPLPNCDNIVLTWQGVDDEDGYNLYRGADVPDSLLAELEADAETYTDTPPPGTYQYWLHAFNECGEGAPSSITTRRLEVPPQVENLTATDDRCDGIELTWSSIPEVMWYDIERDGVLLAFAHPDTTYLDDVVPIGTHSYRVKAFNLCGAGEWSVAAGGELLEMPGQVQNLTASDDLCGVVRLTWTAATGDVDGYEIFDESGSLGTVPMDSTAYSDTACTAGSHHYQVAAFSESCGSGELSDEAEGVCHDDAGTPTDLFAGVDVCDQIELSWSAAPGEVEEYRIYRDGVGEPVGSSTETEYTDSSVDDPYDHEYVVTAYNSYCDEDAPSVPATGHARVLTYVPTEWPIEVVCLDTIEVDLDHCPGVEADSVYLSISGGEFEWVTVFAPPVDHLEVPVPDTDSTVTNNRVMLISVRGERRDTLISEPFTISCLASDIVDLSGIPTDYCLDQNYPNPFNPSTTLEFGLPKASDITISVFDILGRQVGELINTNMPAGRHSVTWNCSDCATGIYLIVMETPDSRIIRKAMLMR